ncbi:hypothetical protein H4R99_008602, partial [Coemansia sp. RSA 1722]
DMEVDGVSVELALWDTAGQEEFDRLRFLCYPDANVIIICFSIDSPDSLLNVEEKWHVEAQQNSPRSPIILVGLKLDLRTDPAVINELAAYGQKPVSSEEGERIARSIGAQPPPVHRKIVVVGDGASGKTCALRTFHENQFPEDDSYIPTVFDTCIMDMPWRGHQIELGLWDTAGQEDYDRLRMMSYENTDIVLMCFSVDSIESLENTNEKWLPEIQTQAPNAKVLL